MGCKDIGMEKSEFVAKTQFLQNIYSHIHASLNVTENAFRLQYKDIIIYKRVCVQNKKSSVILDQLKVYRVLLLEITLQYL